MRLLTAHRILIGAAIALGLVMVAYGAGRGEWLLAGGSGVAAAALSLYLRRLYRNPPGR